MLKRLFRSRPVQLALGSLFAAYLRLVRATSRILVLSPEGYVAIEAEQPAIVAMWHGQHLMTPFLKRPHDRVSVLISRHGDGEVNAIAARKLGFGLVRGSGAQRADQIRKRGGMQALRAMLTELEAGGNMALTADVPKVSRVCGDGIILLASLSGRPIFPAAVVCRPAIHFRSWDAASLGLPFGRAAVLFGSPIRVPRQADAAAREAARLQLEQELDRLHAEGYAALGGQDPGAGRPTVAEARRRAVAAAGGP